MRSNMYQNKINKYKSEGLSYGGREKGYNLVDLKRATLWKSRCRNNNNKNQLLLKICDDNKT
jgi:hypothetical protein